MIVAARWGAERREFMEAVVSGWCRHCGLEVAADTATIRVAENADWRRGRPIEFFCLECHALYDMRQLNVLVDHRGGVRREPEFNPRLVRNPELGNE